MLSDKQIQNLKLRMNVEGVPESERFEADGLGLYVRLTSSGDKTFVYRYSYNGHRKKMTLGSYPEMSLAAARAERLRQAQILADGKDPGQLKAFAITEKRGAITVAELGESFHKYGMPDYEDPHDAYSRLKRDPIKLLGPLLVQDVTPQHLSKVFRKMVDRGSKVAANRTLALTKQMFQYAVDAEHVITENPAAKLKPRTVGGREKSKDIHLLFDQIQGFLKIVVDPEHGLETETILGLKLILGTTKRPLEVVTLEWAHVNLDRGTWLNPSHLTKEKRGDHLVFLNEWILKLLRAQRAANPGSRFVLPSPLHEPGTEEAHIRRHTLSRAVLRLFDKGVFGFKFTPHDLRRTFSSRMADLGVAPHVVEKCQDHLMVGTMAVYNRASYFPERRAAMDVWGKTLQNLEDGILPAASAAQKDVEEWGY